MVAERGSLSTGDVVAATGLTRQAVHLHLKELVERNEIQRTGAGRGARYVQAALFDRTYEIRGLEEDVVWQEVAGQLPPPWRISEKGRSTLQYAFTEMLNNAIDHSSSPDVRIRLWMDGQRLAFSVQDRGVGVFAHVRSRFGLPDDFAALEIISKGKTTTLPDRHSGEGIFFTSKAVEFFVLEANGLRWTIDNERNDQAVGEVPREAGTRVRCEIVREPSRTLQEVFAEYAVGEDLAFSRTRVAIRLFQHADRFISRSEAKRLAQGLERFDEAILDFTGVSEVGQGFLDELFRVWARDHPGTRLMPTNAVPAVQRMIDRALAPRNSR